MFKNYLMTAGKVFMRRKLFTAINLLCIVLTLAVLLVVTALLETAFFPSGVEGKSERFLQVMNLESLAMHGKRVRTSQLGYKLIDKYLRPMTSVQLVSAVTSPQTVAIYQDERVSQLLMRRADANYWKILDFTLLKGRLPTAEDDAQARFVAVVNASTAKKLFPDGAALGQKISIGGPQYEIIGIVEDAIHFNALSDIWAPIGTYPSSDYQHQLSGDFTALLLAKRAADLPAVRAEVQRITSTVQFDDPNGYDEAHFWADSKLDLVARDIFNTTGADSGGATLLMVIGALMLLFMLLPALNLVNLNMGRIMERSGEIGVRKAFGATSADLIGQLVLENVLLCISGGLIALACAQGILSWLSSMNLIPYLNLHINWVVFASGLLLSCVFGLLSGVIPAWKMSRLDPVVALKGGA